MDGSYPRKRHLDNEPQGWAAQELLGIGTIEPAWSSGSGPHLAGDFAQKLFAYEALQPPPAKMLVDQPEPYSLQWFLDIENQRHSRQGRWIPKLMEFAKHSGEVLLGLGHGLGTDWVQYARHGASVLVCSSSSSQLELVRRNFDVRGLAGQFVQSEPNHLPLDTASVDVACLSSLHMGIEDAPAVIEEIYRVLKPGGKVLAVTAARYNVDFWFDATFFWYRWFGGRRRGDAKLSVQYTGAELRRLFAPFVEHKTYKRQLRRSDVPKVWRWIPLPLLARCMGRVLVLKAFKPLSAALGN